LLISRSLIFDSLVIVDYRLLIRLALIDGNR